MRMPELPGTVDGPERRKSCPLSTLSSSYGDKDAIVEHVFGVVKRLRGFSKVRYRGLQKNATRAFTVLALANIYLSPQILMALVRP